MKDLKVLGTGCPKCKKTISIIEEVVSEKGLDVKVEKVEDIMDIMKYDVMSTPAVVVDNEVVIKGRVPSKSEVEQLLQA